MSPKPSLRIGLLALHWGFFDTIMPPDFRREKETISWKVVEFLSAFGRVIYDGLITDEASGRRHGELFREQGVDCVVVFVHMATPGAFPWEALREFKTPILVWNAHLEATIPDSYDMPDLCRKSSNVGVLMLTNVLLRNGRRFELVTGVYDDPAPRLRVEAFLRAAAAHARLRHARIGVLGGSPIPGYLDVEVDPIRLEKELGVRCIFYPREVWLEHVEAIASKDAISLATEFKRRFKLINIKKDELERSCRVALALQHWMDEEALDAATINCHTNYFRQEPRVGVVACLAASRSTTAGRPVACTGDILTTIAMLIGKALGAAVLYCECDLIDYQKNAMAMANTGECDYTLCHREEDIHVLSNPHFGPAGTCGQGACHFLRIAPGAATLIGFSPNAFARGGWSLIAAPGVIRGTIHDRLTVGNCEFEFERQPVVEAFNAWAKAGAAHHGALSTGDLREEIILLAGMMEIEGALIV